MNGIPMTGRQTSGHEIRAMHVRGIGYVMRTDAYRLADGTAFRVRTVGARRLGTDDLDIQQYLSR